MQWLVIATRKVAKLRSLYRVNPVQRLALDKNSRLAGNATLPIAMVRQERAGVYITKPCFYLRVNQSAASRTVCWSNL